MLRLLSDENFNGDILRGLLLRRPDLDLVRVQDVGLAEADDPEILAWAAEQGRILLTHDHTTMPNHAYEQLATSGNLAGVFVLSDRFPVGQAINEILLMMECSEQSEWSGRVVRLPL